ncbi:MAG: class I SAM-dependent methyltransferase [Proteobacteria bacterium]|nr:class I SAM-dependent methyltransferase [Pseudomonadota bacterium]MBS0574747.1 class I SAM-dependent methyltransferase [Pseudomonadota bacterium]
MSENRIPLALADAGGLPDAGRILVLRPGAGADLSALPRDRALIATGFRPDHDRWQAAGWTVARAPEGDFAAAVLFLPRARALARALMHDLSGRLPPDAPVVVDGQKTDGIDSALKDLRSRATILSAVSKAHGRAFVAANPGPAAFEGWQAADHTVLPGFVTRPGVFSADGVDPGSALLAAHLPAGLRGRGADLGAGWGWLAAQVLSRPEVRDLHLVEAEADALDCARRNVTDPRARFHWADATGFAPGHTLDFVVTNPPFHQGRAADPGLGAAFIRAARRLLQPQGQLWLVANRTLPYEEVLAGAFGEVATVAADHGFKVLRAARPLVRRRT